MENENQHSKFETGHAKNVANFLSLIEFCESFGADYNPAAERITVTELRTKYVEADNIVRDVQSKFGAYAIAINMRQKEFQKLEPLCTRIVNSLDVLTDEPKLVADAQTIIRKIRGKAPKLTTAEADPGQEVRPTRSNSQQSYDMLVNHFRGLIQLIKQVPSYTPNEADLQISSLEVYFADLKTRNSYVINMYTDYSKARLERTLSLYNRITGLVSVAKSVKKYVKSVFGASSLQYRQVMSIEFKKQR